MNPIINKNKVLSFLSLFQHFCLFIFQNGHTSGQPHRLRTQMVSIVHIALLHIVINNSKRTRIIHWNVMQDLLIACLYLKTIKFIAFNSRVSITYIKMKMSLQL
jgi:hypothetical protein